MRQTQIPLRRIAVLLPAESHPLGQRLLSGIARYARPDLPWTFVSRFRPADTRSWLADAQPDGVIMHCHDRESFEAALDLEVPVVDYWMQPWPIEAGMPTVRIDNRAAGEMVAHHLLQRGFENFAFFPGAPTTSQDRLEGFRGPIESAGHSVLLFDALPPGLDVYSWHRPEMAHAVRDWLDTLPKPLGILAYRDPAGILVLEQAHQISLRVPQDVAVVGITDDEGLCELAYPPMSSVRTPYDRVGYEAAAMLHQLMEGEPPPRTPLLLAPLELHIRQSSDVFAISDEQIREALHWIQTHAGEPVDVGDLLRDVPIARRRLERRFRGLIGRSPAAEIRRVHVERAKHILLNTDAPMADVAARSGFANAVRMAEALRREVGMTPTAYRARR